MKRREFISAAGMGGIYLSMDPTAFIATGGLATNGKKTKRIKIGQIGISHEHAGARLNSLKMLPDIFEIVGIVDDRESNAARFAGNDLKTYDGLTWMTEDELLNYPGIQAVIIETANTDLVPTAMRCMNRNLAIAMDKPGGEDLHLFGKLLDGCKERKLPFQMGYMLRGNPAIRFCQKALRENWLGDIFEIQASMSHNYGGGEPYQRYLSNFEGGIMFNLGCHLIDLIVSMLGRPANVTPFLRSTKGAADGAKNNTLAVLEYPNSIVWINSCDREVDGLKQRRLKICGSNGTIELLPFERFDGVPLKLTLHLIEGNKEYPIGNQVVDFGVQEDRYVTQLVEFAKIINGEMENPYSYDHDYLTQEVHLAASGYTNWNG